MPQSDHTTIKDLNGRLEEVRSNDVAALDFLSITAEAGKTDADSLSLPSVVSPRPHQSSGRSLRHNVVLTRAPSLRKRKFQAAVVICHFWGNRNVPDSDLIFQKVRASLPSGDRVVTFGFIAAPLVFGSKHEVAVRASPSDVNFPSYGRNMVYINASEHFRKLSTSSEPLSGTLGKDPEPHGQMLKGQIY